MVAPIRRDDVVTGLGAAVITHHQARLEAARQEVGQETLARVSETQIDDHIGSQKGSTPKRRRANASNSKPPRHRASGPASPHSGGWRAARPGPVAWQAQRGWKRALQ